MSKQRNYRTLIVKARRFAWFKGFRVRLLMIISLWTNEYWVHVRWYVLTSSSGHVSGKYVISGRSMGCSLMFIWCLWNAVCHAMPHSYLSIQNVLTRSPLNLVISIYIKPNKNRVDSYAWNKLLALKQQQGTEREISTGLGRFAPQSGACGWGLVSWLLVGVLVVWLAVLATKIVERTQNVAVAETSLSRRTGDF